VEKKTSMAEYGVGGGIVWDSTPRGEWNECWVKAKSLHRQSPAFSLLETMLWTPEGGYHLLPAHLARLMSSAEYFDFIIDMGEIKNRLNEFSRELLDECWKIRLLVGKNGRVSMEKSGLKAPAEAAGLSQARKPVDRADPFLYHKTTHRQVYNDALPENPRASGVILWNEQAQVTESTTANIVMEIDDFLYTPPVRCGLLAGTYRQFLLSCGMVRERVILLEELKSCSSIYLVNSVRGFIPARLV